MKRLMMVAAVAAMGTSAVTQASDTFQNEFGVGYAWVDTSFGDFDALGLHFTRHFSPVSVGNLPRAEAGFLQRSSQASLSVTESGIFNSGDSTSAAASVDYYIPDTIVRVGASVAQELSGSSFRSYGLSLGARVQNNWELSVDYADLPGGDDAWSLSSKSVHDLGGGRHLATTVGLGDIGGEETIALGADYYLNQDLSVGASYSTPLSESDPYLVSIRGQRYFSPNFSMFAEVGRGSGSTTVIGLGLNSRF